MWTWGKKKWGPPLSSDKAELLERPKGQQTVGDMEPWFCQVVGRRLARPSSCTFQLLESGPMGLSPEAAKPEIAPMPKAVGQDQAHPATICQLTLANLDQRGLSNRWPNVPMTSVGVEKSTKTQAGARGRGRSFLLPLREGHQSLPPCPLIVPSVSMGPESREPPERRAGSASTARQTFGFCFKQFFF